MKHDTRDFLNAYAHGYFSARTRGIYEQLISEIDILRKSVSEEKDIIDYVVYRLDEITQEFLEDFGNDYPVIYWESMDENKILVPEAVEIIEDATTQFISEVENVLRHYNITFERGRFKLAKCSEDNK